MQQYSSLIILVVLLVVMYFLMIRPQRKKDKEVKEMRNSIKPGDEVVTIGGICGKVVKTKDESFIIQVGADKVKFEMMKWAISSVVKSGSGSASKAQEPEAEAEEKQIEEEPKKKGFRKLGKKEESAEPEKAAEAPAPAEEAAPAEAPETEESTEM